MEGPFETVFDTWSRIGCGTVIGAAAVPELHAQAKPPIFVITEIDISDPEGYGNEFVPKLKPSKHLAPSS